jgi:hypothetical protein
VPGHAEERAAPRRLVGAVEGGRLGEEPAERRRVGRARRPGRRHRSAQGRAEAGESPQAGEGVARREADGGDEAFERVRARRRTLPPPPAGARPRHAA